MFHVNKGSVTAAKSKLEKVNSSVAEINQWLNEIEENVNKLDAVARDQISEKHISECKVSMKGMKCRSHSDERSCNFGQC